MSCGNGCKSSPGNPLMCDLILAMGLQEPAACGIVVVGLVCEFGRGLIESKHIICDDDQMCFSVNL